MESKLRLTFPVELLHFSQPLMQMPLSVILEAKERLDIFSVSPDATVLEAVQLMNRERIGSVLVCGVEGSIGIFTERDVLVRVVAAGRDPATTLVGATMTRPFVAVRTTTTVEEAMRIITTKRCRHLPVRGEDDKIVGVVSIGDLTRWIVRDQENQIEGLFDYIAGRYPA
jgi:CBS domain-containing protein